MSEIGSRPYPEAWGAVQKIVAEAAWNGANERDLMDLSEICSEVAGMEDAKAEQLFTHAVNLERHHEGSGLDAGPEALRADAKRLLEKAERARAAAALLAEGAELVREHKVKVSVIGAYAQADQETWEDVLRQTADAPSVRRLAEEHLAKAVETALSVQDDTEAALATLGKKLADLDADERAEQPEDVLDDGPAVPSGGREHHGGQTQAMSASAPAPEHHKNGEHEQDGQGQDDGSASTSAMSAATLAPAAGFGAGSAHTPTSYGGHGSHHDAAGLTHAGASGLVDGEDPDQWLVDLAREALARIAASFGSSLYGRYGSPLHGMIPSVSLEVAAWWDSGSQARLSLATGEGLGRWVPLGHQVPERVDFVVAARDLRERAALTARACFERVARAEGGRAALVAVACNAVPFDGDAEHVRVANLGNEDGYTREAVLVGAALDGGGEAGGRLCHRLWHLDPAAFGLVADVPGWALGPCAVEVAAAATNAADTNKDEDNALQAVIGAWREGRAPGDAAWAALPSLVRQSSFRCGDIRAQLAVARPEEVGDLAGDMAQPASVFSAAVALLLAPGVWQAGNEQDGRERLYDVAYELLKAGGDLDMLRHAVGRATPGGHSGFVR